MYAIEEFVGAIKHCLQCNFCLSACPIYREELVEIYAPRGRLNLVEAILVEKMVAPSEKARQRLDRCLLCASCARVCPGGIPLDDVFLAARVELSKKLRAGLTERFVVRQVLNRRVTSSLLKRSFSLARRLGLAALETPQIASPSFTRRAPREAVPRGRVTSRVAYFVGCGTEYLFPDTGEALLQVLPDHGIAVVVPEGQTCCGLPALALGDLDAAREAVEAFLAVFAALEVDAVITDCTSCGHMLRQKALHVLPPDDPRLKQLRTLSDKIFEVTEFLEKLGVQRKHPLPDVKVTYHVPCHREWSEGVVAAPRRLLAQAAGVRWVEMREPESCCGAGGHFFLRHRELAEKIRRRKIEDILATKADVVVTQCPACRYYLQQALVEEGGMRVLHPVSLLAGMAGAIT